MKSVILGAILSVLFVGNASAGNTYEELLEAKICKDWNNAINCSYKIGNDFHMEIAGVGQADAAVIFMKSDFDGSYYGKFGVLHGCAIITKPFSLGDMAFVSPKNGKVYKSWKECAVGM